MWDIDIDRPDQPGEHVEVSPPTAQVADKDRQIVEPHSDREHEDASESKSYSDALMHPNSTSYAPIHEYYGNAQPDQHHARRASIHAEAFPPRLQPQGLMSNPHQAIGLTANNPRNYSTNLNAIAVSNSWVA